MARNISYKSIIDEIEREKYGIRIYINDYLYTQFVRISDNKIMCSMFNEDGIWKGFCNGDTFQGEKGNVANWCLDHAVNDK